MSDNVLINEHQIGTCKMTSDLEEAYLLSCNHNNTTPEDLSYFRSYIWNLFSMVMQHIDK